MLSEGISVGGDTREEAANHRELNGEPVPAKGKVEQHTDSALLPPIPFPI